MKFDKNFKFAKLLIILFHNSVGRVSPLGRTKSQVRVLLEQRPSIMKVKYKMRIGD